MQATIYAKTVCLDSFILVPLVQRRADTVANARRWSFARKLFVTHLELLPADSSFVHQSTFGVSKYGHTVVEFRIG